MAGVWNRFTGTLLDQAEQATGRAQQVWEHNEGEMAGAFAQAWQAADGPINNIKDAAATGDLVGVGLMICAGVVLALKISVITQLVILAIQIAQAIATAVVTFGASLAEIPIFRQITKMIVDKLLDLAIEKVMS